MNLATILMVLFTAVTAWFDIYWNVYKSPHINLRVANIARILYFYGILITLLVLYPKASGDMRPEYNIIF